VEQHLIKAAQSGDREALVKLLREIESQVYRTAYYLLRHEQDALDVAQEALIKIYTKIDTYEEKAQFTTGVQRIVTNVCMDKVRSAKATISIDEHQLTFLAERDVEQTVVSLAVAQDVRRAIQQLPDHYRTVVILRYLQDFSYEEIAACLGLPLNTVKSYLYRAKFQLQSLLGDYHKGGANR
jgi:RNA polymerase sigma-70 factor (ECF subfamily)